MMINLENKIDLKELEYSELEDFLINMGEKRFRAQQIFKWLNSGVTSFDEMTDISKQLREQLAELKRTIYQCLR